MAQRASALRIPRIPKPWISLSDIGEGPDVERALRRARWQAMRTVPTQFAAPNAADGMGLREPLSGSDPSADEPLLARLPWLTNRRIVFFVLGWMLLFGVINAFVSNPFQREPSAHAAPNYWHVMFPHGLLIWMVALAGLLTCQVFELASRHVRIWIALGALAATVPAAIGGIFDKAVPGYEVPMWIQIAGFFALDEILLTLLVGFLIEHRRRAPTSRTLAFLAATVASASLLIAAVMGHIAG
jgi:hypothetical protein